MKGTFDVLTFSSTRCLNKGRALLLLFLVIFLLCYTNSYTQSTEPAACIENNKIEIRPAVCEDNRLLLRGTIPTVTNGAAYTYIWEINTSGTCDNDAFQVIPGATGPDYHVPISAETRACYRRVVLSDGCRDESTTLNMTGQSIQGPVFPSVTTTQPTCDVASGSITVTAPATATGYSIDGVDYSNITGIFKDLPPNTYMVTVKYAIGCTSPLYAITIDASPGAPSGTISPITSVICEGESQQLVATGGTSYQWSLNGAPINGATSATYMATKAGTYRVTITRDGCSAIASNTATVTVKPKPVLKITSPASSCTTVDLTATAITSGSENGLTLTYWTNAAATTALNNPGAVSSSGTYYVKAMNDKGCGTIEPVTVTITPLPGGTISPAAASICAGEKAVLTISGGTTYQWYKDNNAITGATAASFTATEPGLYTVEIINGTCKGKASNSVTISQASAPSGTISPATGVLCSGSSVQLNVTGGASYQWYRNDVLIAGATAATYTARDAGVYSADIITSEGCKGRASNLAEITAKATPGGAISPAAVSLCPGGTATLTATGGTSYQWYKNGVAIAGATQNTYTITTAGIYSADVLDGTCKGKATNEVEARVSDVPSGTISPAQVRLCVGGIATLTATGGTAYQWLRDGVVISGATAATYTTSQPGQYSVTIINGNCSGTASNTAVVSMGAAITFSATATNPNCTVSTGAITVGAVSGGSGNSYQYSKDNGITYQAGNSFADLAPGTYQLVVKDNSGCKSSPLSVIIKPVSNTLSAVANATDIACGQSAGVATITATGGTAPYSYSLDGGATQASNVFNNLAAGAHKVLVKDAAGCTYAVSFTIKPINSTLQATAAITPASCGQATGAIRMTASGGTPEYQYQLDNGAYQTDPVFSNVTLGEHIVKVKDKVGCTYEVTVNVTSSGSAPQLVIQNPAPVCTGATVDLRITTITAGSEAGLTFTYWTNAVATIALANPEAAGPGTYYIKGTNQAGCFSIKPVVVEAIHTSAGTITPADPPVLCTGESVALTASSGVSYQWYKDGVAITGATGPTYQATEEGRYSVAVNNGTCVAPVSNAVIVRVQVCVPAGETKVFVPTAFTPNRDGENDLLQPYFLNIRTLVQFKVYNRWGQLVYQTTVIGQGWDGVYKGVAQPAETYSWILECIDNDGKVIRQSGRSLLIR